MSEIRERIQKMPPMEFSTDNLISSDDDIESRRVTYVTPSESSLFGHQTLSNVVSTEVLSRKSTFRLSSAREFMDLQNCYLQGELQFHLRTAAVADAGAEANLGDKIAGFLERGGVHSLIQSIVISSGSAELMRLDEYPKIYNMLRLCTKTKEDLEFNDWVHLDSYYDNYCEDEPYNEYDEIKVTAAGETTYTAATRTLLCATSGADTAVQQLLPGDTLKVVYLNNGGVYRSEFVKIESVNSRQIVIAQPGLGISADYGVDGGNRLRVYRIRPKKSIRNQVIQAVADSSTLVKHKFAMRIPFNILSLDRYFAVPFLKAPLEITITWNYAYRGVVCPSYVNIASLQAGYKVSNLKFMTSMVQPSNTVFNALESQYVSGGFMYRLLGIENVVSQLSDTQNNISFHSNKSSLKSILCVIMDRTTSASTSFDAATVAARCESGFLKDALTSARVKVGGMSYPEYGVMDLDAVYDIECNVELQRVFGKFGLPYKGSVVRYNRDANAVADFVFGFALSKDDSFNVGADSTRTTVELELKSSTPWAATRTLYSFLMYDQVLLMSDRGIQLHY